MKDFINMKLPIPILRLNGEFSTIQFYLQEFCSLDRNTVERFFSKVVINFEAILSCHYIKRLNRIIQSALFRFLFKGHVFVVNSTRENNLIVKRREVTIRIK